ncbi:MAG TPA: EamA family transporter [Nannocystaceae bacterium]|nr:EamA family transporter [Nannocystaceae bacterium]
MGIALALVAAVAWSALDALRKRLAVALDPAALAVVLTLGYVPIFAVWMALDGGWYRDPSYFWIVGLNGVINAVAGILFLWALRLSPLGVTIPLLALTPALTAMVAGPLLGEWPTRVGAIGIAAVVVGAFALAREGPKERLRLAPGSLLMALVAVLWAVAGPLDKLALGVADVSFHAACLALVAGGLLAAGLALRGRVGEIRGVSRDLRGVVAALVVVALAQAIQFVAFTQVQVSVVETIKRAVGMIMAVALGRIFFGEVVTTRKVAAIVAMLAGTALLIHG